MITKIAMVLKRVYSVKKVRI